jgi:hypothetical protein
MVRETKRKRKTEIEWKVHTLEVGLVDPHYG